MDIDNWTRLEREAQLTSDRDRHRQTWTRLTDIEREAQLRSNRDRHRLTRTRRTNREREARLTSDRHRQNQCSRQDFHVWWCHPRF